MTTQLDQLEARVRGAVQDDPDHGIFRCHRSMFTDPAFFELEMKHIFEGNWIYMAHESQIPEPGDYYTLTMGRTPVVITRDKDGELHALVRLVCEFLPSLQAITVQSSVGSLRRSTSVARCLR